MLAFAKNLSCTAEFFLETHGIRAVENWVDIDACFWIRYLINCCCKSKLINSGAVICYWGVLVNFYFG